MKIASAVMLILSTIGGIVLGAIFIALGVQGKNGTLDAELLQELIKIANENHISVDEVFNVAIGMGVVFIVTILPFIIAAILVFRPRPNIVTPAIAIAFAVFGLNPLAFIGGILALVYTLQARKVITA